MHFLRTKDFTAVANDNNFRFYHNARKSFAISATINRVTTGLNIYYLLFDLSAKLGGVLQQGGKIVGSGPLDRAEIDAYVDSVNYQDS